MTLASDPPNGPPAVGPDGVLHLCGFVLDLAARELLTRQREVAPLRRQALDVLLVLGRRAGQVVGRDELMQKVWPDVVVGEGSLVQAIVDIRRVLGDSEHRVVRNVARRGYMLVPDPAPARDPAVESLAAAGGGERPAAAATVPAASPALGVTTQRLWFAAAFFVVLAAVTFSLAWQSGVSSPAVRTPAAAPASVQSTLDRDVPALSIVVLPLVLEGDSKESEWFADALLGDLTTEVARLPGSFVIARDTAHTYKGKTPDPREVARELRVRYVVRGSLRHEGPMIRLNLALVDGENGVQRWAEKFVFERARLPQALDEFVYQMARVLSLEVARSAGDRTAAMSPDEVTADDLAMRAFALWIRGVNRDNVTQALALLEQAVARDPDSLRGWGGLAFMSWNASQSGWTNDRAATMRRADEAAAQLVRLDPDGNYTFQAKAVQAHLRADWPAMLRVTTAWIAQHPDLPNALGGHGITLVVNGRFEEGLAPLQRALRLSPRDSFRAEWQYRLALIHFYLGQYEKALEWGRTAQQTNPSLPWPPVHAAALVRLGRDDEAGQVFDDFMRRHPSFDTVQFERRINGSHPRVVEGRDRLRASLRSLGMR